MGLDGFKSCAATSLAGSTSRDAASLVLLVVAFMACDGSGNVDTSHGDTSDETSPSQCHPVASGVREHLVDHDLWRVAEPAEDPWLEFRPESIDCDPTGRQAEDFGGTYSFGIDTGLCSYTTIVQASAADVCPGEGVLVWLWRFALTGPEGANAHIVARIGDETVFEDVVPIPATSGLWADTYTAKRFHPAGTPITFHIRNHGNNTYQLLDISRCEGTCRPN